MTKNEAKERIERLRKTIDRYRYEYHVLDRSSISDEALDSLKHELSELEGRFPEFITPDSPTQRVEGKPLDTFSKASHESPMLSLTDVFIEAEFRAWFERVTNFLSRPITPAFYCEPKIDGLAIELVYEHGIFVQGSTRGNGLVGEDVTQNLKTIEAIPLKLKVESEKSKNSIPHSPLHIPPRLVVRGEVFLTKKEFARINREQEKHGGKPYANPRNVAAGSIRQLDPKIAASRKLDSYQYSIVTDLGQKTHEDEHEILRSFGFKTNPDTKAVESLEEVIKYRNYWEKHRDKLPYEIDGVVVILNQNRDFEAAGVVGKAPRGSVAYKFAAREATTVVKDIHVQVGRTGALTPVAELEPVSVSGVTISHATLHNRDEIERLGLKIGDTVLISRAGDVIPKIIKVFTEMRTGKERAFRFPDTCPADGSKVVEDGVILRCSNPNCGARTRESLYHFVSRGGFNIEGLGEKIIDRFMDEGLIGDAADIFTLTKGDIEVLERFGEKSAENIVAEIAAKKEISLLRLLVALGILHVGEETAGVLAQAIFNFQFPISKPTDVLKVFHTMSLENLQQIRDVGPKVAESIYGWFRDPRHRKLIEKLDVAGVTVQPMKLKTGGKFKGMTFVFTGTMESLEREDAKEKVREEGGDVSESVSKKTTYVVFGENPGSKVEKAKKLEVKTLTEHEFLKLLTSHTNT
ncbi:MAG: NAD-dependent DNA ligase LigA [Patescibacteria group bacterium]